MKSSTKVRMNLRVERHLVQWLRAYAKKHGTTMTALIVEGIRSLKRRSGGGPPDVRQI